ncbi:hypothetical protein DB803_19100, partial [Xanthomonas perforans]
MEARAVGLVQEPSARPGGRSGKIASPPPAPDRPHVLVRKTARRIGRRLAVSRGAGGGAADRAGDRPRGRRRLVQ